MTTRSAIWLWGRNPRRTLLRAALLAVATYLFFGFLVRPVRVNGSSMEPTVANGSLHWVNMLRFRTAGPARGDLVAITMTGPRAMFLKRVLGLPGETIDFRDGVLYVNSEPLPETYVRHRAPWNMPSIKLGPEEYFVCGDNRAMPMEEHRMGIVSRRHVVGGFVR